MPVASVVRVTAALADPAIVPTAAVLEGRRVLVVRRGRAVESPVTPGLRNWDWTEVRDGLGDGDVVITSHDKPGLKDGVAVKPKASPSTATGGGTAAGSR